MAKDKSQEVVRAKTTIKRHVNGKVHGPFPVILEGKLFAKHNQIKLRAIDVRIEDDPQETGIELLIDADFLKSLLVLVAAEMKKGAKK